MVLNAGPSDGSALEEACWSAVYARLSVMKAESR